MGYQKIPNLYADRRILEFRTVWAMEKIHGTGAHFAWRDGRVDLVVRGAYTEPVSQGFDFDQLAARFKEIFGDKPATLHGEAYGGKIQGMRRLYGDRARFVGFDIVVGEHTWLDVPTCEDIFLRAGLDFVYYTRASTDVEELNRLRDLPSVQSTRNGIEAPGIGEGIVLRPPFEVRLNNGARLLAKHKSEPFSELRRPPRVPRADEALPIETDADRVAEQWVTPMRLRHVLDHLAAAEGQSVGIERTRDVIAAMIADILTEGSAEVEDTRDVRRCIGAATGRVFREFLNQQLEKGSDAG